MIYIHMRGGERWGNVEAQQIISVHEHHDQALDCLASLQAQRETQ